MSEQWEDIEWLAALRQSMLEWFTHQQRDLPWRRTNDPYAIWLSEIMLQQTRVETVIPYYHRFLERFPTVCDLAEASQEDVLAQWSGLGYYRRARMLHAAAQSVVAEHDCVFPSTFEGILSLKGVGRYTAGAISSIAFGLEKAVVDGNVHRVLARIFEIPHPRGSKQLDQKCWQIADTLVKGDAPGDLNQSLMELGAMVCTPRNPTCMLCPAREFCQAQTNDTQETYPHPKVKKAVKQLQVMWGVTRRRGKILLIRRPQKGLFAGLWELPGVYLDAGETPSTEKLQDVFAQMGLEVDVDESFTSHAHTLTHRQMTIHLHKCKRPKGKVSLPRKEWCWVTVEEAMELGVSSISRKVLLQMKKAT